MKNLVFVLGLAFLSVSCSRDKKDIAPSPTTTNNTIPSLMAGQWKLAYNAEDMNGNHLPDPGEMEFPEEEDVFITFNIDGTGNTNRISAGIRPMIWTVNDKVVTLKTQNPDGSWTDPEEYHITSITTTDMAWQDSVDSATFFIGFVK